MELRELARAAPRVVLSVLAALAVQNAFAASPPADPLDSVKQAIRLKQFAGAASELQRLAAAGNADAQYLLAVFYLNGLNGPRDAARARPLLEKAADQGNARAMISLAALLSSLDPPDAEGARRWQARARDLGFTSATGDGMTSAGPGQPQLTDPAARHEALWLAAGRCDLPVAQSLSDRDSINSHDDFGRGALARAAQAGCTSAVELLVHAGASVDAADQYGITPLMLAARARHNSTVTALLKSGANVNLADHGGNTPLMHAAAGGDVSTIDQLLEAHASVKQRNLQGWSALDFAQWSGTAEAARRLSDSGAVAIRHDHAAPASSSVLHATAAQHDLYSGWTDMAVAASRTSPALMEALAARDADQKSIASDGTPALLVAVRSDAPRSVETLLARDQRLGTTSHAEAGLMLAVRSGDDEIVRVLLARGVKPDARSTDGEPAIVAATRAGHTSIVRLLTSAHADPGLQDKRGTSALMLAAQNSNAELLLSLLDAGAPVEATDKAGRTALWYAAHAGDLNGVSSLLQHGASVDHSDLSGVSPFAAACIAGAASVAERFLSASVRIEAKTARGDTPLLLAAAAGRLSIVEKLLAAHADKDAQNQFGDTALIIASRNGDVPVVKRLLAAGAATRIRNQDRATAADVAEARSFHDVLDLLKG